MTEEERKRYFGILVEDLYSTLQLLSESTMPGKKEEAVNLIYEFYKTHKEDYKINDIKDVIGELDRVDSAMKKAGKKTDTKKMYEAEEFGDR